LKDRTKTLEEQFTTKNEALEKFLEHMKEAKNQRKKEMSDLES